VELSIALSALSLRRRRSHSHSALPNPFVVVFTRAHNDTHALWKELGRTEVAYSDLHPNYITKLRIYLTETTDQFSRDLLINVYHHRTHSPHFPIPSRQKSPILLGYASIRLHTIMNSPQSFVHIPLKLKNNGNNNALSNQSLGAVFLAAEVIQPRTKSVSVLLGFRIDHTQYGGPKGEYKTVFIVSKQLKNAPGHWLRVYRSEVIPAPGPQHNSVSLQQQTLSTEVLFCDDEQRPLLIEMYHVNESTLNHSALIKSPNSSIPKPAAAAQNSHALNQHELSSSVRLENAMNDALNTVALELVASVVVTATTLRHSIESSTPILLSPEPHSLLQSGVVACATGSVFDAHSGVHLIFSVRSLHWYASENERLKHGGDFVQRDLWATSWARLEASGSGAHRIWRGSSYICLPAVEALKSPREDKLNATEKSERLEEEVKHNQNRRISKRLGKVVAHVVPRWSSAGDGFDDNDRVMNDSSNGIDGGHSSLPILSVESELDDGVCAAVDDVFGGIDAVIDEVFVEMEDLAANERIRPVLLVRKPSASADAD